VRSELQEPGQGTSRQLVAFRLDETAFGFDIGRVQEILQMVEITPVPDAPVQVRGAVNVRGTVIPIIDLRTVLGLPDRPYGTSTPIILVQGGGRVVGMTVDDVSDVLTVDEGCFDTATREDPLGGRLEAVCKLDDEMLFVLDPDSLTGEDVPELEGGTDQ